MTLFSKLNIIKECRKYDISLWQCPQFLFLLMGFLIAAASILIYLIGLHFIVDPAVVAIIVLIVAAISVIIAFIITNSFERLAEANRLKSEFVSIASHQLRTPISNMKWSLETLMSGRLGKVEEKELEYFSILKENVDRMGSLVSDLLTVSRIEAAKLSFKKESFSLKDLVEKIIKENKPWILASNSEVKTYYQENLPSIFSDKKMIANVINNLLANAIHYTKGRGKITIRIFQQGKDVYFEIKDNGIGIPEKDQKYIFQKFFRASNALSQETQGTGLGLYIAKSLIEKLGGKIGFRSKEGEGTTFWFKIPTTNDQ